MEVQIEAITSTPTHLQISMLIRGPKHSWVKFAQAIVPIREVPVLVIRDLLAHVDGVSDVGVPDEEDQPLPLDLADDAPDGRIPPP